MKILPSITSAENADWRKMAEDVKKFNLKEIALFPTTLIFSERRELYSLLEKLKLKSIVHVHLRDDSTLEEINYLIKRFRVKIFNTHPAKSRYSLDFSRFPASIIRLITIENLHSVPDESELKKSSGLCVDFAHWKDFSERKLPDYEKFPILARKYFPKVAHISAIKNDSFSSHHFDNLNEFNYLKKYLKFLPEILSLELDNPIKEQLEVKEYLKKIIANQ